MCRPARIIISGCFPRQAELLRRYLIDRRLRYAYVSVVVWLQSRLEPANLFAAMAGKQWHVAGFFFRAAV
jgi:hypothetical protein